MAYPSQNASHSQSSSPGFPAPCSDSLLPDFASLAATLHSVAQALLRHCGEGVPSAPKGPEVAPFDAASPGTTFPGGTFLPPKDPGEIRSYLFSPLALRQECELLEEQEADDFRGLLFNAYSALAARR